jgi:hypothetical protein
MVHQIPVVPHCAAAHAASGIREAVSAVEVSIGGSVYPAPPIAASRTISQAITRLESAAIRRYRAPSAITAGSVVNRPASSVDAKSEPTPRTTPGILA